MTEDPKERLARIHRNLKRFRAEQFDESEIAAYLESEGVPPAQRDAMLGKQTTPEAEMAAEPTTERPELNWAGRFGAHTANTLSAIPGAEAAIALVHKLAKGQTYTDALSDVRAATSQVPGPIHGAERVAGVALTAPFTAGLSPLKAGALFGGAMEAGKADPSSIKERARNTAMGIGAGGALGVLADRAITAGAAMLPMINPLAKTSRMSAANAKTAMTNARSAAADQNYAQALGDARGKIAPQEVRDFLAQPDIAKMVDEIRGTRGFQHLAKDSPEMLDQVYKQLSEQVELADRGLHAVTPTRTASKRLALMDAKAAQSELLDAVEQQGFMPRYAGAIDDYAKRSNEINAFDMGWDAVRRKAEGAVPSGKNINRNAIETVLDHMRKPTTSGGERAAARSGALKGVRAEINANPLHNIKAVDAASRVREATEGRAARGAENAGINSLLELLLRRTQE